MRKRTNHFILTSATLLTSTLTLVSLWIGLSGSIGSAGATDLKDFAASFDFESGDYQGLVLKRLPSPDSSKIQSQIVRRGNFAAQTELRPGDYIAKGIRAEISDQVYAPRNTELWYAISIFIPENFTQMAGSSCLFAQWHDSADNPMRASADRNPPLAIRLRPSGALVVNVRTETPETAADLNLPSRSVETVIYREENFKLGVWHDFMIRANFDHSNAGFVELYIDGKLVGSHQGGVGYNDILGPYFKFGVYCHQSPLTAVSAYHDEYRRGRTRAEVELPK